MGSTCTEKTKYKNRKDNLVFARMKFVVGFALVIMVETVAARQVTVSVAQTLTTGKTPGKTHALAGEMVDAYIRCYEVFMDGYFGSTYRNMCQARDKLTLCKQKVKAVFPKIEDSILTLGYEGVCEYEAKFWCTHEPDPYGIPIEALYYKFTHCPNVHDKFLVLPTDYSPRVRLLDWRNMFASTVLISIKEDRLRQWQPHSNYSDPADPVYQALSSFYCAKHYYIQYNTKLVDKYCIIGYVYRDLTDQLLHYSQIHNYGLYNWQPSMCPSTLEDPMKKILDICELDAWLKLQTSSSLHQCHASNVAVRGGSCLIMFYTQMPPYTDVHLFMPGFCKPINKLIQCWDEIFQMCPKQSMNSDMEVLIKLHQLACDLSQQDSSLLWDAIYSWSNSVRNVKSFQSIIQMMSSFFGSIHTNTYQYTTVVQLPFASTLNTTLTTQRGITPQIRSLLKQMVILLNRVALLRTDRFEGLNVLYNLCKINYHIANIISFALIGPIEFFLMVAGSIEYDPTNYTQWPWNV